MRHKFVVVWQKMYIKKLHRDIQALNQIIDPNDSRFIIKFVSLYIKFKNSLDTILRKRIILRNKLEQKVASELNGKANWTSLAYLKENNDYIFCLPTLNSEIGGISVAKDLINGIIDKGFKVKVVTNSEEYVRGFKTSPISELPYISGKIIQIGIDNSNDILKLRNHEQKKIHYLLQGFDYLSHNDILLSNKWVNEYVYQYDSILTLSPYLDKSIKQFGVKKSHIIPTFINHEYFHYNEEEKQNICLVSLRNDELKGTRFLIPQIHQLKLLGYRIHAFGEYKNTDVLYYFDEYYGRVGRKELGDLLRKSKYLIDPSLIEGVGLLAFEAMACGTFPLIFRRGGTESILKELDVNFPFVDSYLNVEDFRNAIQADHPSSDSLTKLVSSLRIESSIKKIIESLDEV